ncbi:MAG: 5-(carboxyamino)imidazole ribonucleotide synthase [Chloroflexota bacterium]
MLSSQYQPSALTVGLLGGGQLAKMLAMAAYRMGLSVAVIENSSSSPAGDMTKLDFPGGWNSKESLEAFIDASDVVTLENEFISPSILEHIEKKRPVYPTPVTMRCVQDKLIQKTTFRSAGIDVPAFGAINSKESAMDFAREHGFPIVLKTRTLGYDGYGNALVRDESDLDEALSRFDGRPLFAEKFINFERELAVIVARGKSGETAVYPCVETIQKDHICHEVIAPARAPIEAKQRARDIARKCVESIEGVGVFGVELFYLSDGHILVNEIAPRPHNSGHYTIEACHTSQYENGLRAILGLPLGSPEMTVNSAVMINLLGEREGPGCPANVVELLKYDVALHLYNKKQCRKGRKMGHLTAIGANPDEVYARARAAAEAIEW